jgi:actin-related protein
MAEGRRMFQLFAARLFEQRVLTAFRQRIADERQKALLEELEEEKSHDVQREAKKQRDAQKRKEKKQQQKHAKAEEKARREAEKKAEEDAAKALEAQKQEEQRKKKEEQRKKKEAERKAQEDERLKKETEKLRRQQEERERQQEVERKAREQKAQEKKARDEARRKQIEDKEAKEREAREKKASTERQRKEREEKSRAEKDTQEMAKRDAQAAAQFTNQSAQATRRTAPTVTPVAVPPLQRNPSGFSSPHVAVATPAIPKAPTPVRARPGSQQGSKGSSPKTPQVQAGLGKSNSPLDSSNQQQAALPALRKTVLPKPIQGQAQVSDANILSSVMHGIPPPGMSGPPGFGLPPLNGFQQSQAPPMRTQQAMFPNIPAQNTSQFRQQVPLSMPPAPPGMAAPGMPPIGRMFSDIPPGLQQPVPGLGATHPPPGFGPLGREMPISHAISGHARQASGSSSTFEHPIGTGPPQVVSRPAPIQRPSSVKPHEDPRFPGHDIEELSHQLGSSALLDDSDESFHNNLESRRPPAPPGLPRAGSTLSAFGPSPIFTQSSNQQRMDGFVLGSASNTASSWGTPPSSLPFGQGHISPAATWNSPTGGWPAGNPAPNPLSGLGLNPGLGSSSLGTLSRSRPVQLRTTVCALFRQMPADAYKDVGTIMRTIERVVKPPAGVEEILDILDTEGNEHNGGGTFTLQVANGNLEQSLVRWNAPADKKSVGAIGDIGSPNVMSSVPAGPPGLFPGLGAHHTAYH